MAIDKQNRAHLVTNLRNSSLFRDSDDTTIDGIIDLGRSVRFEGNQIIFSKGDAGDCLYIVLSGQVAITTISPAGKEMLFNLIDPGAVLGEIAMIDGGLRTASAHATRPTELFRLDRHGFMPFVASHPTLSLKLMTLLCERLRWVSSSIEEAVFLDVPRRLARRILHLAQNYGQATPEGVRINQPISQESLASMLGISREMVNRSLKALRANGTISYERGYMVVLDLALLSDMADQAV